MSTLEYPLSTLEYPVSIPIVHQLRPLWRAPVTAASAKGARLLSRNGQTAQTAPPHECRGTVA